LLKITFHEAFFTLKFAEPAFTITGLDMDSDIRILEAPLNIIFQMVAHLVRFIQGDVFGHHQVEVYLAVIAGSACAELVETDDFQVQVLRDGRFDIVLFFFR
jgi:hypothetical protein